MLNYKNTLLVFFILFITAGVVDYFIDISGWIYVVLAVLLGSVLFYGSYFIHSNFHLPVVCKGTSTKNEVALTFDDGPESKHTSQILDILKQNQVPATFFCIGNKIQHNQTLLKRMEAEGHLIGNHSYSHHFFFDLFSKSRMKKELQDTNRIVEEVTNKKMKFFRPPYGVTTPVLAKAIRETGMLPVGWSVRSMDTVIKSESKLVERLSADLKPGDVILLHDTAGVTINSLQLIISAIRNKGFTPVRLDHLFKMEAYG